jgi:GNAT superfamily N-acetyltransferase
VKFEKFMARTASAEEYRLVCPITTAENRRQGKSNRRFGADDSYRYNFSRAHPEVWSVAQAEIIIVDEKLLPRAVELYNNIFRPKRELDFFKRRFMGRYNSLTLLARMDEKPVGFWIGFELKPGMFYHWMGAVLPDIRRHGVGRQLQEAQQAWAKDHGYEYIRCECMNHQREFIHFAVALGYDIVGIRWDSTHADNLIVFEKNLVE